MPDKARPVAALLVALVAGVTLLAPWAFGSASTADPEHERLIAAADASTPGLAPGLAIGRQPPSLVIPPQTHALGTESIDPLSLPTPDVALMEATLISVAPPPSAPRPRPPAGGGTVSGNVWDALAQCESGGNWAINTGNGYYGGLQFDYRTWHGYGGGAYAEYPHQATREEQIATAERLHAARGFQPWPACRVKLGLP